MRRSKRLLRSAPLLLALVVGGLTGPSALAQEGTPPAAATFPITPDPAECVAEIAPRPLEEIAALAAAATPVAVDSASVTVPVGAPADHATAVAVTATVRTELACVHAGDFLRNAAFYTDDAVRKVLAEEQIPVEDVLAFFGAAPAALPAEARTTILAVTDVMVLEDGRVGAFFVFADPGAPPVTNFLVFVEAGGRWLVDDGITFAAEALAAEGTPPS